VPEPLRSLPDVLVLAGGGTLGEAWMRGLLAGAEAGSELAFRDCEYFVGTSAGSIVAATLAAGRRPEAGAQAERAYAEAGDEPVARRSVLAGLARAGSAAATPLAPLALAATAPGGRLLRAAALSSAGIGRHSLAGLGRQLDALGARFDGRLRVAAVDRRSGRRVVFGAPGEPRASVRDAVLASCSIPWYFEPVEIGGREYVDGGAWSPTNLDAAPAGRGSEVLCLNPTAAAGPLRPFSVASAARETMALRARGARVSALIPDAGAAAAMGPNLMDGARTQDVLAAGWAQGRRLVAADPAA